MNGNFIIFFAGNSQKLNDSIKTIGMVDILRCDFGNPFHSDIFKSDWAMKGDIS